MKYYILCLIALTLIVSGCITEDPTGYTPELNNESLDARPTKELHSSQTQLSSSDTLEDKVEPCVTKEDIPCKGEESCSQESSENYVGVQNEESSYACDGCLEPSSDNYHGYQESSSDDYHGYQDFSSDDANADPELDPNTLNNDNLPFNPCEAQDAETEIYELGCAAIFVKWNGSHCEWLDNCSCTGSDCDELYSSEEECQQATYDCAIAPAFELFTRDLDQIKTSGLAYPIGMHIGTASAEVTATRFCEDNGYLKASFVQISQPMGATYSLLTTQGHWSATGSPDVTVLDEVVCSNSNSNETNFTRSNKEIIIRERTDPVGINIGTASAKETSIRFCREYGFDTSTRFVLADVPTGATYSLLTVDEKWATTGSPNVTLFDQITCNN